MSEDDQVLNRMEYHTYKILKEQNDKLKKNIQQNSDEIARLNDEFNNATCENTELTKEIENQQKEINDLTKEIQNITVSNNTKIYELKDQLRNFEQRYNSQEKKNDIQVAQQNIREPNRYFLDVTSNNDGVIIGKMVFDQKFKVLKFDTNFENNWLNVICCLELNDISHIIKKQIELKQDTKQQLTKVVTENEVILQIG